MRLSFAYSDEANRDLKDIIYYLETHARPAIAERFVDEVDRAVASLCGMPGLGAHCELRSERWKNLQRYRLNKFKSYIIYFRVEGTILYIERVLHGARDRDAIFGR